MASDSIPGLQTICSVSLGASPGWRSDPLVRSTSGERSLTIEKNQPRRSRKRLRLCIEMGQVLEFMPAPARRRTTAGPPRRRVQLDDPQDFAFTSPRETANNFTGEQMDTRSVDVRATPAGQWRYRHEHLTCEGIDKVADEKGVVLAQPRLVAHRQREHGEQCIRIRSREYLGENGVLDLGKGRQVRHLSSLRPAWVDGVGEAAELDGA